MKLISFNVRGLNAQSKQKAVEKLIYQEAPHIVCVSMRLSYRPRCTWEATTLTRHKLRDMVGAGRGEDLIQA